ASSSLTSIVKKNENAMSARRVDPDGAGPSMNGWAIASIVALLGVALASDYLFPRKVERSERAQPPRSGGDGSETAETTEERDRGRGARTPSAIPARGWKDILLRVYANVSAHRIMSLAAGMTYYSILAIF